MKFNKDTFLRDITERVQNAIDKGVIKRDPERPDDTKPLEQFVQYALLDYVKDRAFSIDVLKNISIDERKTFHEWENEFGEIKSLIDIALIDLFLFLKASDVINYATFTHDNIQTDKPMLDAIHTIEDEQPIEDKHADEIVGLDDEPETSVFTDENDFGESAIEEPRRRVRFVKESKDSPRVKRQIRK